MSQYQDRKKYFQEWERKQKRWKDPRRNARAIRWAKDHPERIAEIMRKHNYGITPEEYDSKKRKQENRCALCGKKEYHIDHRSKRVRALSVDHDHVTKKVRDLLCGNCNRGLGLFFHNVPLLLKAIKYLMRHKRNIQ